MCASSSKTWGISWAWPGYEVQHRPWRPRARGLSVSALWSSAFLVELAVAITLVEGLALALYRRWTGRGLTAPDYALNLLSGLCLMLAVRSALLGHAWYWGAGCLAASGAAHVIYLRQRWQRQRNQAFLA